MTPKINKLSLQKEVVTNLNIQAAVEADGTYGGDGSEDGCAGNTDPETTDMNNRKCNTKALKCPTNPTYTQTEFGHTCEFVTCTIMTEDPYICYVTENVAQCYTTAEAEWCGETKNIKCDTTQNVLRCPETQVEPKCEVSVGCWPTDACLTYDCLTDFCQTYDYDCLTERCASWDCPETNNCETDGCETEDCGTYNGGTYNGGTVRYVETRHCYPTIWCNQTIGFNCDDQTVETRACAKTFHIFNCGATQMITGCPETADMDNCGQTEIVPNCPETLTETRFMDQCGETNLNNGCLTVNFLKCRATEKTYCNI